MNLVKNKITRGEKGFWSAFVFLFLVTLGLLGLGAYAILRSEGVNVANELDVLQTNSALDAGAFYALNAMKKSLFTHTVELTPLAVGETVISLDTSKSGTDIALMVTATTTKAVRQLRILMHPGHRFQDNAIMTTGTVTNVTALDSARNTDTERLIQQADSIPTVKIDSLKAMAVAQGHKKVGNWTATSNYPMASFFRADGVTPNVTWITGNLTMNGSDNIYGIFIVEGNVTINGTGRIEGVLYLPNVTSTIIKGGGSSSESSIVGGIISHGDISGKGSHVTVQHNPTYMREFSEFLKYTPIVKTRFVSWVYL